MPSYKLTNPMLTLTALSILIRPNTLTVLLEYINLQSQSKWQSKANIREELPILDLTLTYV